MEHVRILQDGFWERTAVVRDENGRLFVRKESTRAGVDSPWGQKALRAEIDFLRNLSPKARKYFPPLVDDWQDAQSGCIGYLIPFYSEYHTAAEAVLKSSLTQPESDRLQTLLAEAVFSATHQPAAPVDFVSHLKSTIENAIVRLRNHPQFRDCVDSTEVSINGKIFPGLSACFDRVCESPAMAKLKTLPTVLLHGDLILENVLWNPEAGNPIRLIDPVSVAGITRGPALFDLVKYVSYASGELFALRTGKVIAGPDSENASSYEFTLPLLPPFRRIDLLTVFNRAFETVHGERSPQIEQLLDGYFSLVMAVNTQGAQQWGRVLKGILALHAASETLET